MKDIKNKKFEDEKLFKFILRCNKNHNKPDLHSFIARIKNGTVWVECQGYEVYVEYEINGDKTKFIGTPVAVTNRLEMLGIDLSSIDM